MKSIPDKSLRKRSHPRLYRSFELTDQAKAEPYQRAIRATEYTKYDTTSQISMLPGCVKRDEKEISDNYYLRSRNTESYNRKVIRDYKSQVACLPGSVMKDEQRVRDVKQMNCKRYESHDIFLTMGNEEKGNGMADKNGNSFNMSCKRRFEERDKKLFSGYSLYNMARNPSLYSMRPCCGIRRYESKNRSQIQIC